MKHSHPAPTNQFVKNDFWSCCPRRLGYHPETPCANGKLSTDPKQAEKGCPWGINSPEDNYCFWTWLRRKSDADGFLEPVLQHEMAELLGSSGAKLHAAYKEAVAKMKDLPEFESLEEIFED